MKKLFIWLIFLSTFSIGLEAQQSLSASGACANIPVTGVATLGISVTGTWATTLQPEVSIAGNAFVNTQVTPSTSSTAQSTITASGAYIASVAGYDFFQICFSSYSSGTAVISYRPTSLVNASLFRGGGGSGTPGGSSGQVQYNNSGAFAGLTGLTESAGALTGLNLSGLYFTNSSTTPSPAGTSSCPSATSPLGWVQDAAGNWQTQFGIDPNSNNVSPGGTLEFCRRTWFTDLQVSPPFGNNAFISMDHLAGTGTSTANQDRALWINMQTPTNDATSHYGMAALQSEFDFNCNGCSITGSPDAEVAAGSFQMSQVAATAYTSTNFGTHALRAHFFKSGASGDSNGNDALYAVFVNNNATNSGSFIGSALSANCQNSAGGTISGMECAGVKFIGMGNAAFGNGTIALHVISQGGSTVGADDYVIKNDIAGVPSLFNGPITATAASFTTLAASSTLSGTGFTNYFASPPSIGGTVAGTGAFSTLTDTGITGITQCVHVNSAGVFSGTGSDCGSGGAAGAWSSLTAATGNLSLANGANTTTFQQTSAADWLWDNTTTATVSTTNASPVMQLGANYWTGSASAADTWSLSSALAAGANAASTLSFTHSGSTGIASLNVPTGAPATSGSWGIGFGSSPTVGIGSIGNYFAINTSSANPGGGIRLYQTGTLVADIGSSASGGTTLTFETEVSNGELVLAGLPKTGSAVGVLIGGDGGANSNITSTSGTPIGVSIGNGSTTGAGSLIFAPSATSTATPVFLDVAPQIDPSGSWTGGYTGIRVRAVETALSSSTGNLLLSLNAGSAGTTNEFKVDNTGNVTTPAAYNGAVFQSTGTKFTATGCTSISSTLGGATAGKFTIGASTCTVVITMNGATGFTANNGYSCHANDETTAAGNTGMYFSANTATTATLTVPATAAASDVIDFGCDPF
jgi:hypothetical protein